MVGDLRHDWGSWASGSRAGSRAHSWSSGGRGSSDCRGRGSSLGLVVGDLGDNWCGASREGGCRSSGLSKRVSESDRTMKMKIDLTAAAEEATGAAEEATGAALLATGAGEYAAGAGALLATGAADEATGAALLATGAAVYAGGALSAEVAA